MGRSYHVAMDNISSLQLVLIGEANASDTASIEYPAGTFTQVKFGGSATGTVPSGGILTSDSVSVTIPKGATFYVRRYHVAPTNVGIYTGGIDIPGGDALHYGASGIADQTMGGEQLAFRAGQRGSFRQLSSPRRACHRYVLSAIAVRSVCMGVMVMVTREN